jgi:hypothetical protein
MIHVSMRDEYIADAQEFAGCERSELADIKQQCSALEQQIDVNAWVTERIIYGLRIETVRHQGAIIKFANSRLRLGSNIALRSVTAGAALRA